MKDKNNITDANPYRFDLTGDFIRDGHEKISTKKSRVRTEAKIRKDQADSSAIQP